MQREPAGESNEWPKFRHDLAEIADPPSPINDAISLEPYRIYGMTNFDQFPATARSAARWFQK